MIIKIIARCLIKVLKRLAGEEDIRQIDQNKFPQVDQSGALQITTYPGPGEMTRTYYFGPAASDGTRSIKKYGGSQAPSDRGVLMGTGIEFSGSLWVSDERITLNEPMFIRYVIGDFTRDRLTAPVTRVEQR